MAGHNRPNKSKLSTKDVPPFGGAAGAKTPDVFVVETDRGAFTVLIFENALDFSALTPSEAQVTRMVLDGCSNEEIARQRGVSTRTIVNQLAAVYPKLGVSSRRELKARFRIP